MECAETQRNSDGRETVRQMRTRAEERGGRVVREVLRADDGWCEGGAWKMRDGAAVVAGRSPVKGGGRSVGAVREDGGHETRLLVRGGEGRTRLWLVEQQREHVTGPRCCNVNRVCDLGDECWREKSKD